MQLLRHSILLACAAALGACSDSPTTAAPAGSIPTTKTAASREVAVLLCTARPAARSVSCSPASSSTGANADLIVGGQNHYVNLVSSNVVVTDDKFSFDATIQSLIPQPLGTTDGVTLDAGGVKVFFAAGPTVTAGTGAISVYNPDGTGAFTASNQPYFQYDEMLSQNQTSGSKTWTLTFDPGVQSFAFKVLVTAAVQHPEGYVNLSADTTVYTTSATGYALQTGTYALTATAVSAVGRPKSGATITWTSSDPSIATVDGTGTVTGVTPGTVTISAQSDTLVSSATVSVCPNLSVGQAYVTTDPSSSICIMPGSSVGEYTVMPVNRSTSSARSLTATATGIQAVTGPPSPNLIPAGGLQMASGQGAVSSAGGEVALAAAQAQFAFEQSQRRGLPPIASGRIRRPRPYTTQRVASAPQQTADRTVTAAQGAGTRLMWHQASVSNEVAGGPATSAITPGVPAVGDLMSLNVAQGCSGTPDLRTGQVRSVSQHAIIVGDTANPAGGYTTAQYDSIGLEFDSISYLVDSTNFGAPTDVDANGRVVIFYTRAVNELSPPASSVFTYGYFANRDVFSSDPVSGCQRSNAGEILYMMVPDPTGAVNSNVRTVGGTAGVRPNGSRELTHLLEHLINAFRRAYVTGADSFEEPWLDEGLGTVAQELAFYRTSGMTPRVNIQLGTGATNGIQLNSRRVAAFNAYANLQFTNFRAWLTRPDTAGPVHRSTHSDVTGGGLSSLGSMWAFLRYSADRLNGNDAAFWYSLVNSNLQGTTNLQNAIGGDDPMDWFRDFVTGMYVDDNAGITGLPAKYTQPSWNFRSMYSQLGGFSLPVKQMSSLSPYTSTYAYGGGTQYLRLGVAANGVGLFSLTSGGAVPNNVALTIVRTK